MYRVLEPLWSPKTNGIKYPKTGIVVHHAAGTDFDAIGRTFAYSDREASAHWAVGNGIAQQFIPEEIDAWHAANSYANQHYVGIECVNSTGDPDWQISEETVQTLCELMADIAKRWGIYPLARDVNVFGHRDFAATLCPGVLYDRLDEICSRANKIIEGVKPAEKEEEMHEFLLWDGGKKNPLFIRIYPNGKAIRKVVTGGDNELEFIKRTHFAAFGEPIGECHMDNATMRGYAPDYYKTI